MEIADTTVYYSTVLYITIQYNKLNMHVEHDVEWSRKV